MTRDEIIRTIPTEEQLGDYELTGECRDPKVTEAFYFQGHVQGLTYCSCPPCPVWIVRRRKPDTAKLRNKAILTILHQAIELGAGEKLAPLADQIEQAFRDYPLEEKK